VEPLGTAEAKGKRSISILDHLKTPTGTNTITKPKEQDKKEKKMKEVQERLHQEYIDTINANEDAAVESSDQSEE